jgi:ElaB/YqjD/DUF883 family membrane-anchored ribosome-binding protein
MTTITDGAALAHAVKDRLESGIQQFEEKVEQGRRAIARGRRAGEDGVEATVSQIKRHPLRAVAAVTAVGVLVGCVVGFAAGRCTRRRA